MNDKKIKDLLYELSDDLKLYYDKSGCCSLIVKLKKDKAEKQQKIEELENINDKISSALNSAEKEIDRLNNIINELDEDIYSLYEDICNSDDTYCYRIPMEIIIDRLDKMSNKITKFNENKLKDSD